MADPSRFLFSVRIHSSLALPCSDSLPTSTSNTLHKIEAHNRLLRKKAFEGQVWDCGICLSGKKGRFCVRFDGEEAEVGVTGEGELEEQGEGGGCGCVL